MKCKEAKYLLADFIENNLDEALEDDLSRHLEHCISCNEALERLQSVNQLLGKKEKIEFQPYYYTSLKQKMENRFIKKPESSLSVIARKALQPILVSLLIIAGMYTGFLIGKQSNSVSDQDYINAYSETLLLDESSIIDTDNNYLINDYNDDTQE